MKRILSLCLLLWTSFAVSDEADKTWYLKLDDLSKVERVEVLKQRALSQNILDRLTSCSILVRDNEPNVLNELFKKGLEPNHLCFNHPVDSFREPVIRDKTALKSSKYVQPMLLVAVKHNKEASLKALLLGGANAGLMDLAGQTAIDIAAKSGYVSILCHLLAHEESLEQGFTPLHIAAAKGNIDDAKAAIKNGYDPDSLARNRLSPFMLAYASGAFDICQHLVTKGADPDVVFVPRIPGNVFHPLIDAIEKRNAKSVDFLLSQGCLGKNLRGNTSPMWRVFIEEESEENEGLERSELKEIQQIFLKRKVHLNKHIKSVKNLLVYVAQYGTPEIMHMLVKNGSDPDKASDISDYPLAAAIRKNRLDMVKTLVKLGAKLEVPLDGQRSLQHIAARTGNLDIVLFLESQGLPVTLKCRLGVNLLYDAYASGNQPLIDYLLKKKLSLHHGALLGALQFGEFERDAETIAHRVEMVKDILRNSKVSVNVIDPYQKTYPLHLAVRNGDLQIIDWLLKRGANIQAVNSNKETALDMAVSHLKTLDDPFKERELSDAKISAEEPSSDDRRSKEEKTVIRMVKHLLAAGANPNCCRIKDPFDETPLIVAAKHDQPEIAEMLLRRGAKRKTEALMVALEEEALAAAGVCTKYGARFNRNHHSNVTLTDYSKKTRSWLYAKGLKPKTVDLLAALEHDESAHYWEFRKEGAEVNEAIMVAAMASGLEDIIIDVAWAVRKIDLRKKAANRNYPPVKLASLLIMACNTSKANSDIINRLLSRGADANGRWTWEHKNAITAAVQHGRLDVVKTLVGAGADIRDGAVLTRAISWKKREIAQLLLNSGAKLQAGKALYQAALTNDMSMVIFVVDNGADIHTRENESHYTPLSAAIAHSNLEMMEFFLKKGVKTPARRKTGRPGVYATYSTMYNHNRKSTEIIALLEKYKDNKGKTEGSESTAAEK